MTSAISASVGNCSTSLTIPTTSMVAWSGNSCLLFFIFKNMITKRTSAGEVARFDLDISPYLSIHLFDEVEVVRVCSSDYSVTRVYRQMLPLFCDPCGIFHVSRESVIVVFFGHEGFWTFSTMSRPMLIVPQICRSTVLTGHVKFPNYVFFIKTM
jgi:hypothetical protein